MSIRYIEKTDSYLTVLKNRKSFSYSVSRHGPMAELLAEKSEKDGRRHNHIFEEHDDYDVMKIYHAPSDIVYDIFISKEDREAVELYKWFIAVPENSRTLYVVNDKVGKLHRFILQPEQQEIVDHINRNGLDNRRENLRIVTVSQNSRNMDTKASNKLGHNGVAYCPAEGKHSARYRVHWQDADKNFRTKSFSIKKYPDA